MNSTEQRNAGQPGAQGNRGADLDSREGDPRKRDQQDMRTLGRDGDRDVDKDDPSRAPASGTP